LRRLDLFRSMSWNRGDGLPGGSARPANKPGRPGKGKSGVRQKEIAGKRKREKSLAGGTPRNDFLARE